MISIILPTYKESENIEELITRIYTVVIKNGYSGEILIMEDYSEDTINMKKKVIGLTRDFIDLRLLIRHNDKGLSQAVWDGVDMAKNDIIVVMDSDLQHNPEDLPLLIEPLRFPIHELTEPLDEYDMIIGAREDNNSMSIIRRIISYIATLLGLCLGVKTKDPMSGFFAFKNNDKFKKLKKDVIPIGFKIGLEIMVKCNMSTYDVPIIFGQRYKGESKMKIEEILLFIFHIILLSMYILSRKLKNSLKKLINY